MDYNEKRVYRGYAWISLVAVIAFILLEALIIFPKGFSYFSAVSAIAGDIQIVWFLLNILLIIFLAFRKANRIMYAIPALFVLDEFFSDYVVKNVVEILLMSRGLDWGTYIAWGLLANIIPVTILVFCILVLKKEK